MHWSTTMINGSPRLKRTALKSKLSAETESTFSSLETAISPSDGWGNAKSRKSYVCLTSLVPDEIDATKGESLHGESEFSSTSAIAHAESWGYFVDVVHEM
mmetsp:Transcript_60107/g.89236  ORF Transcript_60107/g.89236 Transcript_60107/m.89236 type:complete len:101 (-) Transcript_60107:135-437(-)